jgi:hypothetical protein
MKLPNHTALKEWASVIAALGRGEQAVLIRKGGIADPNFGVEAPLFYLYPTYFHEQQNERETVPITHWCEVVRTWRVSDRDALDRLAPLVVIPREALETRYRVRPDQALHVIGVRTFRLPAETIIKVTPEYAGCRSWVSIDDEIDVDGSSEVLGDYELTAQFDRVQALL